MYKEKDPLKELTSAAVPNLYGVTRYWQGKNKPWCCLHYPMRSHQPVFIENALDMAQTMTQIMTDCGIPQYKAKLAIDTCSSVLTEIHPNERTKFGLPSLRLNSVAIYSDLGRKSRMNVTESRMAYQVIKSSYKAFYYPIKCRQDSPPQMYNSYAEQCAYGHAAKRIAELWAKMAPLPWSEECALRKKIKFAYKLYYERMLKRIHCVDQPRRVQPPELVNCPFYMNRKGHLPLPPEPEEQLCYVPKINTCKCPLCCPANLKRRFVKPRDSLHTCPMCHRYRHICRCDGVEYEPAWVESIWMREDFAKHCRENIIRPRPHKEICPGGVGPTIAQPEFDDDESFESDLDIDELEEEEFEEFEEDFELDELFGKLTEGGSGLELHWWKNQRITSSSASSA